MRRSRSKRTKVSIGSVSVMTDVEAPQAADSHSDEEPEENGYNYSNGDSQSSTSDPIEDGDSVNIPRESGIGKNLGSKKVDRNNDLDFEGVGNDAKVDDFYTAIKNTGVEAGERSGKVVKETPVWANKDIRIDLAALESKKNGNKDDSDDEDAPKSPPPEWQGMLKGAGGNIGNLEAKIVSTPSTPAWANQANQSARKFSDPENGKTGVKSDAPSWAKRALRTTNTDPESKPSSRNKAKTDVYDRTTLRSTGVNLAEEEKENEASSSDDEPTQSSEPTAEAHEEEEEEDEEEQDDAARRREKRAERRKASQQQQ